MKPFITILFIVITCSVTFFSCQPTEERKSAEAEQIKQIGEEIIYKVNAEDLRTTAEVDLMNELKKFILEGIYKGKLKAYLKGGSPMKKEDVEQIFEPRTDTILAIDPVTREEIKQVVVQEFNPEHVSVLKFKETWHYDEESSEMVKRVKSVAFMKPVYDSEGNMIGDAELFWVDLHQKGNTADDSAAK